ncbi:MAG: RagB/SusD family nutrient uptake outer membrane protein [Odoribacter sp.]
MKTYIISLFLSVILFTSCQDFLEEKSQDKIIPKSIKDYREFFFGEAYLRETSINSYIDIMTDDVKENIKGWGFGKDTRNAGYGYYTWQSIPEDQATGARNADNSWASYYHTILICNIVLREIDDISGEQVEKDDLKAEAYALRAYSYFMLVNLYGIPYQKATAETDLGVPLNKVVGMEDVKFKRESVATIYRQIEQDLQDAIHHLKNSNLKKTYFRWNLPATYLLASRVKLYKKEYNEAIQMANECLLLNPNLYDLKLKNAEDRFLNSKNPEILLSYGYYLNSYYAVLAKCNFPISDDLFDLYKKTNDLRLDGFYNKRKTNYTAYKNDISGKTSVYGFALRTSEAYLNRAEAYAESGESQKAIDDLNTIRQNRLSTYTELKATTPEEVIQLVREERRMELAFEGHRWFDLRRWDRPQITHIYTPNIKQPEETKRFILEKNDPAYTLPIPRNIMEYEPDLIDNPRPERIDQNAQNNE